MVILYESRHITYPTLANLKNILSCCFDIANVLRQHLKQYDHQPIILWCRGTSGLIMATNLYNILYEHFDIHINYVRKENEHSHCPHIVNYKNGLDVFVDDFIDEGYTFNIVLDKMRHYTDNKAFDITVLGGFINNANCFRHTKTFILNKSYCEKYKNQRTYVDDTQISY